MVCVCTYVNVTAYVRVVKNVQSVHAQMSFIVQYLYIHVILIICRAGVGARFGEGNSIFGG